MPKDDDYTMGTCAYCGQTLTVGPFGTQEEADEQASLACGCPDAREAASEMESEDERAGKREQTLEDARADITDLFGEPAAERGDISVSAEVCDGLYQMAVWVYDQELRSVTIGITQSCRAKISVTDKGKLTIQRDDSFTRKREHK